MAKAQTVKKKKPTKSSVNFVKKNNLVHLQNLYPPCNHDRIFVYVWSYLSNMNESKFGDVYVKSGDDPTFCTADRIKNSQGVAKFNFNKIHLEYIWDVTDLAIMINRMYPHSKMDDFIRPSIGHKKSTSGDFHTIPASKLKVLVDQFLNKANQPLPIVGLAAWQARAAERLLSSINQGYRTHLATYCPRFGKTIWSGSMIKETGVPLTIVASYVLTSFASFEKDLSGFEQFRNYVLIDTSDDDYQDSIQAAISNGNQVVAFLSMCNGSLRSSRIDYLFNLPCDRMLFIDEADFGVHKLNQADVLINSRKPNDNIVIMTGTNGDKAASCWNIDNILPAVTYIDLLLEKKFPLAKYTTTLKHFKIDPKRHDFVVDLEFYQMDFNRIVNDLMVQYPDIFDDGTDRAPSWTKFAKDPTKAKGFFTKTLQAIFLGQHGYDELNVDSQIRSVNRQNKRTSLKINKVRADMIFLPASMTNENLNLAVDFACEALGSGFRVVGISGETMTNRTAEPIVKEELEKAEMAGQKRVILFSTGMAQRSFTRGEIDNVYLAYDNGEMGATLQKLSRVLSPDHENKIGRVFTLSFDPNRDDKYDSMILSAVSGVKESRDLSTNDAYRLIMNTIDIYKCTTDGEAVKMKPDEYLNEAMNRNGVSRVLGTITNMTLLSPAEITALANNNLKALITAKTTSYVRGATYANNTPSKQSVPPSKNNQRNLKEIAKARETIVGLVENINVLVRGANTTSLTEAFDVLNSNSHLKNDVNDIFNIPFDFIYDLFERGAINKDLVELQVERCLK